MRNVTISVEFLHVHKYVRTIRNWNFSPEKLTLSRHDVFSAPRKSASRAKVTCRYSFGKKEREKNWGRGEREEGSFVISTSARSQSIDFFNTIGRLFLVFPPRYWQRTLAARTNPLRIMRLSLSDVSHGPWGEQMAARGNPDATFAPYRVFKCRVVKKVS